VPADRLVIEQSKLQRLAMPYGGRSARTLIDLAPFKPIIGYQHALSVYDSLLPEGCP
jgi:hypothetical protein